MDESGGNFERRGGEGGETTIVAVAGDLYGNFRLSAWWGRRWGRR
jgi:hypothetical protein